MDRVWYAVCGMWCVSVYVCVCVCVFIHSWAKKQWIYFSLSIQYFLFIIAIKVERKGKWVFVHYLEAKLTARSSAYGNKRMGVRVSNVCVCVLFCSIEAAKKQMGLFFSLTCLSLSAQVLLCEQMKQPNHHQVLSQFIISDTGSKERLVKKEKSQ